MTPQGNNQPNLECVLTSEYVSSPSSCVKILTPNMEVLGGGAFGDNQVMGTEPSWMELVPYKDATENSPALSRRLRTHSENTDT